MTKLLSGFVLPSQTSSMQPAVHISHTRTWAFCLKWLADLKKKNTHAHTRTEMSTGANAHTHAPILTSDAGINLIHRWRAGGATHTHTHTCAYLALAITSVSVNRKRCLSWVCIPVFSWAWPWRRNDLSEPLRKDWTNGQLSGHTGTRKLSLEHKHVETKSRTEVFSQPNMYLLGFTEILEIYDFMFIPTKVQKLCYTYVTHPRTLQLLPTVCNAKTCFWTSVNEW